MAYATRALRHSPWNDLMAIHREFNRHFNQAVHNNHNGFHPPIDVLRTKDSFIVRADLPGMTKEAIEVSVLNNRLYLRGEKKATRENGSRQEQVHGAFERTIDLPAPVDQATIRASYTDGVLEVVAPIAPEAQPRKIEVKVTNQPEGDQ